MKRSLLIGWHKWLAIPFAIALLVWVVSGLVMLAPGFTPNALGPYEGATVAWEEIGISPAEAAEVVNGEGAPEVDDVTMVMVGERPMYRVRSGRDSRIVDARSGEIVEIDSDLAVELARTRVRPEVATEGVEYVDSHSWYYPSGPLPAYRVRFDTSDNSWAYVGTQTGEVYFSSRELRFRAAMVSLHEFRTLNAFFAGFPNRGLMLIASFGLLGVTATGYYLVFWKQLHGRTKTRGTETT